MIAKTETVLGSAAATVTATIAGRRTMVVDATGMTTLVETGMIPPIGIDPTTGVVRRTLTATLKMTTGGGGMMAVGTSALLLGGNANVAGIDSKTVTGNVPRVETRGTRARVAVLDVTVDSAQLTMVKTGRIDAIAIGTGRPSLPGWKHTSPPLQVVAFLVARLRMANLMVSRRGRRA